MKGLVRTLSVVALLLLGAFTASPAAADPPTPTPGLPLQLALGDSWAFGFGGNPDTAATDPYEDGYVPKLYETLKEDLNCLPTDTEEAADGCKHLQLLNIAEGGETTPSMIDEQFPVAIPLLKARNLNRNPADDVEVTTVHIGGNDVFGPILNACVFGIGDCQQTIVSELRDYRNDLGGVKEDVVDGALPVLRQAAGDETIVIGTYDNPFRDQSQTTCGLARIPSVIALGNLVLEGDPGNQGFQGLHDIMRSVAADNGIEVAEVFGDLTQPADWFDCLHPTDSGYAKVTDAFEEVLGVGQSG